MGRAVPHAVLVSRAIKIIALGAIALFLVTVVLSLAACERGPCWQHGECDGGRQ